MLSSLYQETHRVGYGANTPEGRNDVVPESVEMVQQILQRNGWRTIAVTGGGFMSDVFGFDRGFESFSGKAGSIEEGTQLLIQEIGKERDRPIFAFFHTYQVHSPYQPPNRYRDLWDSGDSDFEATNENLVPIQDGAREVLDREDFDHLEALYDGEIRYTDESLSSCFDELERIGFFDNALVIVTSDHGEEFGDHGGLLHRVSLHEELLHIPLILSGAGVARGVVDPTLVSLIDLAPTILAAAGLPVTEVMEGRNLLGGVSDTAWDDQRVFAQYTSLRYAVRTPRFKLIQVPKSGRLLLFDLRRDPSERRNVVRQNEDLAAGLLTELEEWKRARPRIDHAAPVGLELPADKVEELRALGYID
jgi:arylsulfatase A-like enzyme